MDVPDSTTVSPKFKFPDADVKFKSSDGVLFHIHRKNLDVCTEGFPPAGISNAAGEIVDLLETAEILELLFQFMYPQRHPALDTTPFEILNPLAEAAEKYQVFPAMNICHIRLRDMVHEHPVEVAVYAAKHDYPYLVSQVAPMMLSMSPVDVIGMLPGYLILPWIRYVQEWTRVHQTVALKFRNEQNDDDRHSNGQYCDARTWLKYSFTCIQRLAPGAHTLRLLDNVFDHDIPVYKSGYKQSHECCRADLQAWRKRIEDAISEIPKFHTFL
ncbi:hypothetical protein K438DRAFT_1775548 [Mycena galopus ATCC 62051]|nr:hypothetical protein K438DRAFT_1775548 [Mycena galopus ATCC 62051]